MAAGTVGGQAIEIMVDAGYHPVLTVLDGDLDGRASRLRELLSAKGTPEGVIDLKDAPPAKLATIIRDRAVDVAILAWWQRLIAEPLLSAPAVGFLNFHPSLLPYNRGRHSTFWNLVDDVPYGVSIHWIDQGIDSGPIAFQRAIEKSWTDDATSLHRRAQGEIIDLFRRHLPDIADGRIPRLPQDLSQGRTRYSHQIKTASRLDLDTSCSVRRLLNVVRAAQFPPHPPAYFEDDDELFEIEITIKRKQK